MTCFCIDYRHLNLATRKEAHLLSRIDETLNVLNGQCWFVSLDLVSRYWQANLTHSAKEKKLLPPILVCFTVMPFSLCNAPATFEQLINQILHGMQWSRCLVYINDILVFDKTFNDTLMNLEVILQHTCTQKYGLQLKSSNIACIIDRGPLNQLIAIPREYIPYLVDTDDEHASDYGIGGVLS